MNEDTAPMEEERECLASVSERGDTDKRERITKFRETSDRLSRDMGPRTWSREELYDRPSKYYR